MFIISDSLGETGALVSRAALSQFKTDEHEMIRYSNVNTIETLESILAGISLEKNALVVYTLVNEDLNKYIESYSLENDLISVDLLSPLINAISRISNGVPIREAGAFRKLDDAYFERVAAIEFAVKYDDGKDPRGLEEADIVIIGVSRTSKTPLSLYLANKNMKVANIPLVIEIDPPKELFEIKSKKIIGLTNSPEKLNEIREERLINLGLSKNSNYASLSRILEELEYADKIMRRLGCPIIDVSNKAIEETADIVLNLLKKY